ncbi:MAG: hypothetical protein Q8M02_10545 [Candidatus Didemnitutus sp.]|nr:hypothetical protein [Candidatus Didemnitutus sp.]
MNEQPKTDPWKTDMAPAQSYACRVGPSAATAPEQVQTKVVAAVPTGSGLLETLESMARQNCHTGRVDRDYNGQVAGTLVTDSGAISAHADALETLAEHGRFRIVAARGRMVVGYWPENDPNS